MESGKPLHGLVVVDFTSFVAAPSASLILGYLGAEVIKVEPLRGELIRPGGARLRLPCTDEDNVLYDTCNSYKKDISLDLRADKGREIMHRLLASADAFVTNYRLKALEGIGITYEEVKAYNPAIVYAHFTGLGEEGPDAGALSFDGLTYFARGGVGATLQYKGLPPLVTPYGTGDLTSGLALLSGVLAGLLKAQMTGEGSKVTSSLLSNGLWTLNCCLPQSQYVGDIRPSLGPEHQQFFACADGIEMRIFLSPPERYWKPVCQAFGLEEYLEDERFCTLAAQREHMAELKELIRNTVAQKTFAEWQPSIRKADAPCGRVQNPVEASQDPQAVANHYVSEVEYPNLGRSITMSMPPIKMDCIPEEPRPRGPRLGEHTSEILAQIGYSEEEIAAILSNGTARQA